MQDLLYLVHRIPYPPNKGDKIRSYHLLRHLSKNYRVHLGAFIDDSADLQYAEAARALCATACLIELNPRTARLRSLSGLLTGKPLTLAYYANAELHQWVEKTLHDFPIKTAVIFSSAMAQYVEGKPQLKCIADFVDVDSDKWRQYAPTKPWPLSWIYAREAKTMLNYERKVAAEMSASLFVTEEEAKLFRQLAPESAAKIGWFNNGVDFDFFSPARTYTNPYSPDELPLVFTGAMDYWPNIDAVVWFAHEVFPAVHARFPQARFYIVGGRPAPSVQQLAQIPGVKVTGRVPDVRGYLAHAKMAVAPLRIARGLQNKVLEAMAMAKPVVASRQAAEGICVEAGKDLIVASDAVAFQDAIGSLLVGGTQQMGEAARSRVMADYDWQNTLSKLNVLLD
jgi:sugar transferase (PEP-CTERM/EpsH1 system associated)